MSKQVIRRWRCDKCCADGGEVDEQETIPYRWASIQILLGCPQIAHEQNTPRVIHYCGECCEQLLFGDIKGDSDDIARLRSIFKRPPSPPISPSTIARRKSSP